MRRDWMRLHENRRRSCTNRKEQPGPTPWVCIYLHSLHLHNWKAIAVPFSETQGRGGLISLPAESIKRI